MYDLLILLDEEYNIHPVPKVDGEILILKIQFYNYETFKDFVFRKKDYERIDTRKFSTTDYDIPDYYIELRCRK